MQNNVNNRNTNAFQSMQNYLGQPLNQDLNFGESRSPSSKPYFDIVELVNKSVQQQLNLTNNNNLVN
jgi:hypothetical protein